MTFAPIYPMDTVTMTKTCSGCGEVKSANDFVKNKAFAFGRGSRCKKCENVRQRQYRDAAIENNPDFRRRRALSQEMARAKKYGLTVEELRELIARTRGLCEICGEPPTKQSSTTQSLHVDHCHQTKVVRGMICERCNVTIGALNEDIDLLRKLEAYLTQRKGGWRDV